MPLRIKRRNGNEGSHASVPNEVYDRLGSVETDLAATRAELAAVARQTTTALEELGRNLDGVRDQFQSGLEGMRRDFAAYQQTTRPNWTGIIGIGLTAAVAVAALVASVLNARALPIERDIVSIQKFEDLTTKWRSREIELIDQNNQLKHSELDRRADQETSRNEARHVGQQAQVARVLDSIDAITDRLAVVETKISMSDPVRRPSKTPNKRHTHIP